jgi:hypothetical protein
MPTRSFNVLVSATVPEGFAAALADTPFGTFTIVPCADAGQLSARMAETAFDALVLDVQASGLSVAMVESLATDLATLIVTPPLDADAAADWFGRGVQELLVAGDLAGGASAPRSSARSTSAKRARPTPPTSRPACRTSSSWLNT